MVLSKQKSADDINMGSVNLADAQRGRRARSASPVKSNYRLSLPPYLTTPNFAALGDLTDDLSSTFSSPSVSQDQLRELSRSPISKKLHITRSNYAIPIPFTLKLPPKLSQSAPTTPNKSASASPKSPSRLVFTGRSYEPFESEPEEEYDYDNTFARQPPPLPDKPPAVTSSRKKVAKFVQKTQSIPLDQLSMIEEASTRANSVKSKALPLVPASPISAGPSTRRILRKMPSDMEPVLEAPTARRELSILHGDAPSFSLLTRDSAASPFIDSQPPQREVIAAESNTFTPREAIATESTPYAPRRPAEASVSRIAEAPVRSAQPQENSQGKLPHSTAFHHNLNNGSEELRIGKRTFSDESCVSSVSSFSSVGDFFNVGSYAYGPKSRPELRQQPQLVQTAQIQVERNASTKSYTSTSSADSMSSWNSVQKSLDFSLKDSASNETRGSEADKTYVTDSLVSEDETLPLSIKEKNLAAPVEKDVEEDVEEDIEEDVEEANNGAGIGFNFPNDASNVTNVKSPKKKQVKASRSSFSIVSTSGQIEIPDLDNLQIQEDCSRSVNHATSSTKISDIMEPIGMPSRAAREHFKAIYGESLADSDSDSSFNSQFSKLNQTATKKLSPIKKTASIGSGPATSTRSSPVRHARHRSMYNIDFDNLEDKTPNRNHSRSKSTADSIDFVSSCEPLRLNRGSTKHIQTLSPEKEQREAVTPAEPEIKIVVAEPPKKVEYAVDFKTANGNAEKEQVFHIKAPIDYYHRSTLSTPSHSDYRTAGSSEFASSYQSSRTARETASTAPSDTNSVTIDLTKDGYNVCMIKRNDSQLSYRSVIEKTKDGKQVEVVLVDEDDDANVSNLDRDDLLSIYSRYMNDWVDRSDSVRSSLSEASTATANSWNNSETNFNVKSMASLKRNQAYLKGQRPVKADVRLNQRSIRGKTNGPIENLHMKGPQVHQRGKIIENNYFDYSTGENYDFNTFMDQRKSRGIR